MLWLSAALIAPVSGLDNLGAGIASGLRETRITAIPNAVIAALTMTATAAAVISGRAFPGSSRLPSRRRSARRSSAPSAPGHSSRHWSQLGP